MKYTHSMWLSLLTCTMLSATTVTNDQEAYQYCLTHKQSFFAIIWPIAQGKDKEIQAILNSYGTIKYRKDVYLSARGASKLLQKSHPAVPLILKKAHFKWYFPHGILKNKARIFLVKFKNVQTAVACKQAVRSIFDLQYRSMHTTDTPEDALEMANFFFKTH